MPNEADTCRRYVVPGLVAAGWDSDPHAIAEQRTITHGRIVPVGNKVSRRPQKRADYVLRCAYDFPIAVVEAKASYRLPGGGLGQAQAYAQMLGLSFAYSTNGEGIVEFDFIAGTECEVEQFPTPDELWQRLRGGNCSRRPRKSRSGSSPRRPRALRRRLGTIRTSRYGARWRPS
jgi:type I restriction enzyme, R subunit